MADKTTERQELHIEQRLTILEAIHRGYMTPRLIALRTELSLYHVRRHIKWLTGHGYIAKLRSGYISMITQSGEDALAAGQFVRREIL